MCHGHCNPSGKSKSRTNRQKALERPEPVQMRESEYPPELFLEMLPLEDIWPAKTLPVRSVAPPGGAKGKKKTYDTLPGPGPAERRRCWTSSEQFPGA